jgi:hypothetical protein
MRRLLKVMALGGFGRALGSVKISMSCQSSRARTPATDLANGGDHVYQYTPNSGSLRLVSSDEAEAC